MIRGKIRSSPAERSKNIAIQTNIHNKFEIEVIDAKTGLLKQRGIGYNTLCTAIWSALVNRTAYFSSIAYGSGTGTPSPEDTTLFAPVGYKSVDSSQDSYSVDYNTGIFSYSRKIQLSESTAVGSIISEVGIGTSSKIYTHAMLEDMNGNPISIEKTSTDIINIYATVFVHFNGAGFDKGSLRMDYYQKDYSLLTLFAGAPVTESPNYFIFSASNNFSSAYNGIKPSDSTFSRDSDQNPLIEPEHRSAITYQADSTNRTLSLKAARIPVAEGNLGGLLRFVAIHREIQSAYSYYRAYIRPSLVITPGGSWFPYSEIKDEAVGTGDGSTQDFKLEFPYAYDPQIYVDGVLREDATVDYLGGSYHSNLQRLSPETRSEENLIPYFGNETSHSVSSSSPAVYFNRAHSSVGLSSVTLTEATLLTSNDLVSWEELKSATSAETYSVPDSHKQYKYWKIAGHAGSSGSYTISLESHSGNALHFASPPAEGAVITANYKSDCFAKDQNHVFDLTITFHFGEYTEI